MKYSIMGFNQANILQFNLSISEILLLSYIYDAQASPTMSHIIEDGKVYTWLNHSKIQADLPILAIEERQLKRYINHLGESGLIHSKQVTVSGVRGSRTYYGITETCERMRYDNTESEQGSKMSPNSSVLGVKNVPSDNLLNLDNKLDNTIPKGIVTEVPTDDDSTSTIKRILNNDSEYYSKMYSEDRRKIDAEQPKKKKMSLWDKCVQIINEFTDDEKLRHALTEFLKMRLSIKGKIMYAPQWRAMLERMSLLKGDPVRIVTQSLEHGWAGFYDEKPINGNYSGRKKSVYEITSEHKGMNSNKVTQEEWEEMQRNGEVY